MTSCTEEALVLQREILQKQLKEQRKLIAQQLLLSGAEGNSVYPRSMTMRFLSKRPELIGKIFSDMMALIVGARLFKLLGALLALVKILKPSLINEPKRLPAPL